jgi:esterase/lipase
MTTTRDLTFAGSTGAQLHGVLHVPHDAARGSILLAHCFTCSKDIHTMTRLADGLAEAGYAALRFDFTGLGDSGGQFTESTVSANVRDLTAAATALLREGFGPCGMLGHSLGGAAILLAAAKLHTVRSIVVLGAPSTATHVSHLFADVEEEIRREGDAVACIAGREFPVSREFLDDLADHDTDRAIAELGRPLLVIHAVDDEVVPVAEGEAIFAAAAQPKSFVPILDTDHLVTNRAAAEQVLHHVRSWFERTL